MWTTKKELQTAIKLSVESKTEKFPAFIELGPCQRGADVFADRPDKTALEALERVAHANEQLSRWFGKCEMRACCAAYETRFLEMNRPAPIFNPDQLSVEQLRPSRFAAGAERETVPMVCFLKRGAACRNAAPC